MRKITGKDTHYLNAVYNMVVDGTIPLEEYKKLLGKYNDMAESLAKDNERKSYESAVEYTNQWRQYREKKVREAEEELKRAKEYLGNIDKDIAEYMEQLK